MPVQLTGGILTSYTDTSAYNDFSVRTGTIDLNASAALSNGAGDLSDDVGGGPYEFRLTTGNVAGVVVEDLLDDDDAVIGTRITNDYGTLELELDGSYTFTPNDAAINLIPGGITPSLGFSIEVTDTSDEEEASSEAVFTIPLVGAADQVIVEGASLGTITDTAEADNFTVLTGRIDDNPTDAVRSGTVGNVVSDGGSTYTYALRGAGVVTLTAGNTTIGTEITTEYGKLTLANDGRYQFVPNAEAINDLVDGETLNFTVRTTDSNGTFADAVFTVDLEGAIEETVSLQGGTLGVVTDGDVPAEGEDDIFEGSIDTDPTLETDGVGNVTSGNETPEITYTLGGQGVTSITVDGEIVGTQVQTEYGLLILATDGRYQFQVDREAVEALPEGSFDLNIAIVATDNNNGSVDESVFTIGINGEDDAVELTGGVLATYDDTAETDDFAVIEGTLGADGVGELNGDTGNTRTFELVSNGDYEVTEITAGEGEAAEVVGYQAVTQYGQLIIATDGRYQFVPNDAAINALPANSGAGLGFEVLVTDENGTSSTATFTVDLTGEADTEISLTGGSLGSYEDTSGPDADVVDADGEVIFPAFQVIEGQLDNSPFTTPAQDGNVGTLYGDQGEDYTYVLTGDGVSEITAGEGEDAEVVGTIVANEFGQLIVSSDGRYQFTPNGDAIRALPAGDRTVNFVVEVTSSNGATAEATFTIDLQGSNEAPVVTTPNDGEYYHLLTETNAAVTVTGQIEATDTTPLTYTIDYDSDDAYYAIESDFGPNEQLTDAQMAQVMSALTIDAQTGAYSFNLPSPDFLDAGEVLDLEYIVNVTNQFGEITETVIDIEIEGTNETGPAGTAGDDVLTGGQFGTTINGGSGDDILYGQGGNDILRGGSGDDILLGGLGYNSLDGGSGIDTAVVGGRQFDYGFQRTGEFSGVLYRFDNDDNLVEAHQLINIENVQFGNGTVVEFNSLSGGFFPDLAVNEVPFPA